MRGVAAPVPDLGEVVAQAERAELVAKPVGTRGAEVAAADGRIDVVRDGKRHSRRRMPPGVGRAAFQEPVGGAVGVAQDELEIGPDELLLGPNHLHAVLEQPEHRKRVEGAESVERSVGRSSDGIEEALDAIAAVCHTERPPWAEGPRLRTEGGVVGAVHLEAEPLAGHRDVGRLEDEVARVHVHRGRARAHVEWPVGIEVLEADLVGAGPGVGAGQARVAVAGEDVLDAVGVAVGEVGGPRRERHVEPISRDRGESLRVVTHSRA